jgi:polysaccharide biosynthesis protein PslG
MGIVLGLTLVATVVLWPGGEQVACNVEQSTLIKAAPKVIHSPALGINVHALWDSAATYTKEFPIYREIGISWVRVDVDWNVFEPTTAQPEPSRLRQLDLIVKAAAKQKLHVLLVVLSTPTWAGQQIIGQPKARASTNTPPDDTAYAAFVGLLAVRYRAKDVAFEIWNEPNEAQSFAGRDPVKYVNLLCSADKAIVRSDPTAIVVGGALSGEDVNWLGRAYRAGLAACFDVLSLHPYQPLPTAASSTSPVARLDSETDKIVALMTRYDRAPKPIWFTEFGWSADDVAGAPIAAGDVSPAQQAQYTVAFLNDVSSHLSSVPVVMIYEGKDTASATSSRTRYAGILDAGLRPKPVAQAIACYAKTG